MVIISIIDFIRYNIVDEYAAGSNFYNTLANKLIFSNRSQNNTLQSEYLKMKIWESKNYNNITKILIVKINIDIDGVKMSAI